MQCYTKRPQINPCFTEAIALTLIQLSKESSTLFSSPTLPCHFFISISKEEEMTCVYIGLLIFWDHPPKVSKCGIFREPFFPLQNIRSFYSKRSVPAKLCSCQRPRGHFFASPGFWWLYMTTASPDCTTSSIRGRNVSSLYIFSYTDLWSTWVVLSDLIFRSLIMMEKT